MNVAVVGSGLVGQVSAVVFANACKHNVQCTDICTAVVAGINKGETALHEPGLTGQLQSAVRAQRLFAAASLDTGGRVFDVIVVCVQTPAAVDGEPDYSFLLEALRGIADTIRGYTRYVLIAVRSTVLPGVCEQLLVPLIERTSGKRHAREFGLAFVPEFLRQGHAVADELHPDRLVFGAASAQDTSLLRELFAGIAAPQLDMPVREAELVKCAANAYLALHVSFANELALLADALGGVNLPQVLQGVTADRRHSPRRGGEIVQPEILKYFHPSAGYGGTCLPKDTAALAWLLRQNQIDGVLAAVANVNQRLPARIVGYITEVLPVGNSVIAILGLAFKPGVPELCNSPSIAIAEELIHRGYMVRLHDPHPAAQIELRRRYSMYTGCFICEDLPSALEEAQAIIITNNDYAYDIPAAKFSEYVQAGALVVDLTWQRTEVEFQQAGLVLCHFGGTTIRRKAGQVSSLPEAIPVEMDYRM